jgi:phosphinothricin acetyltransferase
MPDLTIRLAAESDAAAMLAIYEPIVRQTIISFELEPPDEAEMRRRIATTLEHWPWLVCVSGADLLGYAYASQHRSRAAYRWAVDVSAYVHPSARRRGLGRALYTALLALLPLQGYTNAYAGIALPNPASVALHEAAGFEPVGVYRSVGFKLGAWRDVGWWQRSLAPLPARPEPPIPLVAAMTLPSWPAALAAGNPLLP